jgi:hypothetical protein
VISSLVLNARLHDGLILEKRLKYVVCLLTPCTLNKVLSCSDLPTLYHCDTLSHKTWMNHLKIKENKPNRPIFAENIPLCLLLDKLQTVLLDFLFYLPAYVSLLTCMRMAWVQAEKSEGYLIDYTKLRLYAEQMLFAQWA